MENMKLFTVSILCILTLKAHSATQDEFEFDASFLRLNEDSLPDLSRFSRQASQVPGRHRVHVYFNDKSIFNQDILFIDRENNLGVPCLSHEQLRLLPIKYGALGLNDIVDEPDTCPDLTALIPGASVHFDSNTQTLHINVPQIYEDRAKSGYVSPESWDAGIPALLFGYNVNAYQSKSSGHQQTSIYASNTSGLNIDNWFLRHNGNWTKNSHNDSSYQSLNTYLQRDIPEIKGRMSVGQIHTSGEMFDTLKISGVKFNTDERMEPISRRGYAPEIHGIANTNARVTVRQSGSMIYQTTVSPGAFIIDDLTPAGYGGDLDVTIYEADGSEQHFQVPYTAARKLQRPGQAQVEISLGKLDTPSIAASPSLWQATWQHGINNWLTGYAGVQGSEHYLSAQGGLGIATEFGVLSADVTHAKTDLGRDGHRQETWHGESYRFGYNKNIAATHTNFTLATYRFPTQRYMDYMTAMSAREAIVRGVDIDQSVRSKSRYILSATQGLPLGWGQFYVSSSVQNYWLSPDVDAQYQIGYSNDIHQMTYRINAGRSKTANGQNQDTISLNVSFPLSWGMNSASGYVGYERKSNGQHSVRTGVSGITGEDRHINYGVSGTTNSHGEGSSASANARIRTDSTSLNVSLGAAANYYSASAGMNGTIVGHSDGLTSSPYQGNTFALAEAKGAEGAKVSNYSGVNIDRHGYALIPHLNPYQLNDIRIDPKGSSIGVEIESTSLKVAPLDGALVKLSYPTHYGYPLIINIAGSESPLPFGAEVYDSEKNIVGYVGQGQQVFARVAQLAGVLSIQDAGQRCTLPYHLTGEQLINPDRFAEVTLHCMPQTK